MYVYVCICIYIYTSLVQIYTYFYIYIYIRQKKAAVQHHLHVRCFLCVVAHCPLALLSVCLMRRGARGRNCTMWAYHSQYSFDLPPPALGLGKVYGVYSMAFTAECGVWLASRLASGRCTGHTSVLVQAWFACVPCHLVLFRKGSLWIVGVLAPRFLKFLCMHVQ